MAQSNFIPQRGKAYKADDYGLLGQLFTIESTVYRFVAFAAQQFIRKGTLLKVNDVNVAQMMNTVAEKCGGVADFDIDTIDGGEVLYGLIVAYGDTVVEVAPKAKSCVYVGASIVGYDNGVAHAANAVFSVGAGLTKFIPTTQVLNLCATGSQNYTSHVAEGDVIKTNLGHYGVVSSVVNASSLVISAWAGASTNDTSYLAQVTHAVGALQNFGKKAAFTCGAYYGRYFNALGLSAVATSNVVPSVNVCGASTILFVNACVSGSMFKVGDAVKLAGTGTATGTCSFIITSINNAYAFTVNAAPAADVAGMVGVFANVNYYYATARIDGNN